MVQPQNETYTLIIKGEAATYLARQMDRSTGFDLFEKINRVYASDIPALGIPNLVIQLHRNYTALSTKALILEMYIYPDKLHELVQYCQPKLF